jgi:FkbM family methyltransferase
MASLGRKAAFSTVERARLLVHRAGFDVKRDDFKHNFVPALKQHDVTDVLDIGANTGQFATELRRADVGGRIVSVEPLRTAFDVLAARASGDASWICEQAAVSDRPGSLTINVAGNSVSSSVLPMTDRHAAAAPTSQYVASEEVPATTVDDLVARHGLEPERTLLKIDVQGYEMAVLSGAVETLPRFAAVRTEMSLVPLYEGQALLPELITHLTARGFELWSVEPGFVEPTTRRLLQLDGIFFRSGT